MEKMFLPTNTFKIQNAMGYFYDACVGKTGCCIVQASQTIYNMYPNMIEKLSK